MYLKTHVYSGHSGIYQHCMHPAGCTWLEALVTSLPTLQVVMLGQQYSSVPGSASLLHAESSPEHTQHATLTPSG